MIWKPNPTVRQRDFGNQIVLVDPDKVLVHELNEVGTFLWSLVDGARSADQMAQALTEEFEVSHDEALGDVENFLKRLAQLGLIHTENTNAGGST